MDLMKAINEIGEGPATEQQLEAINNRASGYSALLGLKFIALSQQEVVAELAVGEHHLQPAGLVNGGVYCGIGETVGSLAGMVCAPGRSIVGVNNSTDFIASVKAGVITAVCRPIQLGNRTQLFEIIMSHEGNEVARTILRTMVR
ncbi:hotdog fold thioesterase [Corynebacterium poyangense]|uniref:Hotdog fold thioesterase n=1 Tax=Corynebacterium poyangense TaxID=2684405 RepID=A0A7H0SNS1_9CORY|nr:PaaI family thioesterase [Corynebacterium poyangense]MBZ8177744.1 hotdog fold thioesterase [Corynebacterium poyangense]QNQ90196.1 hotdog fold thioesterase [Corynebacterium poyangense]